MSDGNDNDMTSNKANILSMIWQHVKQLYDVLVALIFLLFLHWLKVQLFIKILIKDQVLLSYCIKISTNVMFFLPQIIALIHLRPIFPYAKQKPVNQSTGWLISILEHWKRSFKPKDFMTIGWFMDSMSIHFVFCII